MDLGDPMDCPRCGLPHKKCTAHNRKGKPCGLPKIPGGRVCEMHGGGAPQVKQRALERLMELVDPALNSLARLVENADTDSTQLRAVEAVLDRTGLSAKQVLEANVTHTTFTLDIAGERQTED